MENHPTGSSATGAALDATLVGSRAGPAPELTIVASQSTILNGINSLLTIPRVDLNSDTLLRSTPRLLVDGATAPSLGGIPLLAKLGQGAMGAVYYGIHPIHKNEVAVKVLPQHLAEEQPDLVQRFHREADVASKIHSPHLVTISTINQQNGLYFLVMEFVNGTSAGSHLKQVRTSGSIGLAENDALDLCIAATAGLAAAHRVGVVHRDIKPDNILLPKDKSTGVLQLSLSKLADLGLAREDGSASLTGTNSCMGTAGYMAPEQIMDAKRCGKPADVFCMGATLYALLAGRPPFSGATVMAALLATTQEPHPPIKTLRPDISNITSELLDRCLAKDPAKRFVDGTALLEAMRICRDNLGKDGATFAALEQLMMLQNKSEAGAKVPGLTSVRAKAAVPRRTWVGIAAAVLILVIVGGVMESRKETPELATKTRADPAPVAVQPEVRPVPLVSVNPTPTPAVDAETDAKLQAKRMFQEHAQAGFKAADNQDWKGAKVELELALAILGNEEHPLKYAAKEKLSHAAAFFRKKDIPRNADAPVSSTPYAAAMFKAHTAVAALKWDDAVLAFQEALQHRPTDGAAKQALADASYEKSMASGRRARELSRLVEAETAYEDALRYRANDPQAQRALSELRLQRGIARARDAENDPKSTAADRRDGWRSAQKQCIINSPEFRICEERIDYWSRVAARELQEEDRRRRVEDDDRRRRPPARDVNRDVRDAKDTANKIRSLIGK